MQKFVPRSRVGIFLKNAPDPPHWTLNSYFGVSCTIWMHLGPFGCLTKLSAKRAELMQKYVPWSRVIIFHNEHTRLSPLGPKLMFWCVSYYLGAFGTVWLPYKTWCKTSRSGAKVRAMKSCQNFSQRTYPSILLNPKLMFDIVSYYFCAFSTVRLRYKTQCKTGQTDAKVRATKWCRIFSQRMQPIHHIGLQTLVLVCIVLFGCIWDHFAAVQN